MLRPQYKIFKREAPMYTFYCERQNTRVTESLQIICRLSTSLICLWAELHSCPSPDYTTSLFQPSLETYTLAPEFYKFSSLLTIKSKSLTLAIGLTPSGLGHTSALMSLPLPAPSTIQSQCFLPPVTPGLCTC